MLELSHQDVLSALLDAQNGHKIVRIYLCDNRLPCKSRLLGFNYYDQSLLVDSVTEPLSKSLLSTMTRQPFCLQLQAGERFLNLFCVLSEAQHELYTLKILSCAFSSNQRYFSRIYFDARKGPQTLLEMPNRLPVNGHIKNLSVHGALIEVYGQDLRDKFATSTDCKVHIRFNDFFNLDLTCGIKQLVFLRQPSCHSRLRLTFNSHTQVSYQQLEHFIDTFQTCDPPSTIAPMPLPGLSIAV